MLDRTDHNYHATLHAARMSAAAIADKYIPATDRDVAHTDNLPADDLLPDIETALADPNKELNSAKEAYAEVAAFLKDTPVIQTPAQAKQAGGFRERTLIALNATRAERDTQTAPLNDKIKAIRETYDLVRDKTQKNRGGALQYAYDVLKARIQVWMDAEEAERQRQADEIQRLAEEAARVAAEAEAALAEAIDDAGMGAESDMGALVLDADQAARDAARTGRQAAVAERDVRVGITSVMGGKTQRLHTYDKLSVASIEDAFTAIRVMGLTQELEATLCTMARKHHQAFDEYPAGITVTEERRL